MPNGCGRSTTSAGSATRSSTRSRDRDTFPTTSRSSPMKQPRFPDSLGGARELAYITPKRKRLTEYEAVTCYTQPNVHGGGMQECGDFRLRPDGRPLWDVEASAIRYADWFAYRDPNQQWQRPYYVLQSQAEKSIDRATETAAATGMLSTINPVWLTDGLVGALF